jgi:hypothetical protein
VAATPWYRSRLEAVLIATIGVFGFRQGAQQIHDNGTFTHLRTGIDMANTGAIPRHDPYSFTAHGHPWVVQSWLPEWTYGWTYRLGGYKFVIFEQAVLIAVLAVLLAVLSRAGTPLRTLFVAVVVVLAGAPFWEQRPLIFGLIAMTLLVMIVERRRSPWLLVPLLWLWVNCHGSFPLALVWLGLRAGGEAFDRGAWPRETLRYAGGVAAGLAVSVVNPLGWRLLAFPLTVERKREAFQTVVEWRSPDFQHYPEILTLAALVIALVVLLRRGSRWMDLLPFVGFVGLGLVAERNLPVTAIVLAPALARAVRPHPGEPLRPANATLRRAVAIGVGVSIGVQSIVLVGGVARRKPLYLAKFPVEAVAFLESSGLRASHRMVHSDRVGNYLEAKYGTRARVFMDDRYDMFPLSVTRDYRALVNGSPRALEVLDKWRIDVVLWDQSLPLVTILDATGRWRTLFHDGKWVVLQRE